MCIYIYIYIYMSVHHFWGIKFLTVEAGTGTSYSLDVLHPQNSETVILMYFLIVTVLGGDIR